MAIKRRRTKTKLLWLPEKQAGRAARHICAVLKGDESPLGHVYGMEVLPSILNGDFTLSYHTGKTAPKGTLDAIFQLTKQNMELLYNQSDFLGGWNDGVKYRELSNHHANAVVAFISYRFVIIDEFQPPTEVCYIYEIQVSKERRSRGVGRFPMHAAEIIARRCGAKKLMCTVLKMNTRAVDFYRTKCGFVDDESDPDVVDFEHRYENKFHVLKLILNECENKCTTPGQSDHDGATCSAKT